MTIRKWLVLPIVLIAGCESSAEVVVASPEQAHLTRSEGESTRVLVNIRDASFGVAIEETYELALHYLPDGVRLHLLEPPRLAQEPPYKVIGGAQPRSSPVEVAISASEGFQLYDASGARVPPASPLSGGLRAAYGLPEPPKWGRASPRPSDAGQRRGRVITPAMAAQELADLRRHTDGEERTGPSLLRFWRTSHGAEESFVYDERVGAVVEQAVVREGRPDILITQEYGKHVEGYQLTRAVLEWRADSGRIIRTVETTAEPSPVVATDRN